MGIILTLQELSVKYMAAIYSIGVIYGLYLMQMCPTRGEFSSHEGALLNNS